MRLLHTSRYEFGDFFDHQVPRYAILSHRWGEEEISFKEMKRIIARDPVQDDREGFVKIQEFRKLSSSRGFEWCWIDTCCIDKRSSAELSEAINSMYEWYEKAAECYVYLIDVLVATDEKDSLERPPAPGQLESTERGSGPSKPWSNALTQSFSDSEWFRRGWTLQELIAPPIVLFFDASWTFLSTKFTPDKLIEEISGIESDILWRSNICSVSLMLTLNDICIAQVMSWASNRQTTRKEDTAYCLMGLFGVNMPLLYGEGDRAFTRLQTELLQSYCDESIFAWTLDGEKDLPTHNSMLAPSPLRFHRCGEVSSLNTIAEKRMPMVTRQGLEIAVPENLCQVLGRIDRHSEIQCFPIAALRSLSSPFLINVIIEVQRYYLHLPEELRQVLVYRYFGPRRGEWNNVPDWTPQMLFEGLKGKSTTIRIV